MNKIKIISLVALIFGIISCGKDFDDINIDPNNPSAVPVEYLLTAAEKDLAAVTTGFYIEPLLAQYFSLNNYTEPSRYLLPPPYSNMGYFYAGPLKDLKEIIEVVSTSADAGSPKSQNQIAIARVLMAYAFHNVTDIFGPVPYTDALLGDQNRTPKWDSQKDIYFGILQELNAAVAQMDESAGSFNSGDIIFHGDVGKWKKFARSLTLRVAMRMSDVEPATAQAEVEAAAAFAMSGNGDNAYFRYLPGQPNNNPWHQWRVLGGDANIGVSNILIDKTLKPLADPRLPFFADERVNGGGYIGRPFGQTSEVAASEYPDEYSQPSGAAAVRSGIPFKPTDVASPEFPAIFMRYAEVCFLLAEAKERGWNVPGSSAKEWFDAGITASMNEWGVSDPAVIAAYLAQDSVDYDKAPGGWKQKIGVQKWIAQYMQATEAWTEWRRLDFEKLELPVGGALMDLGGKPAPSRLLYPANEQTQNAVGYQQGLSLLGGPDKLSTRLWWDVN